MRWRYVLVAGLAVLIGAAAGLAITFGLSSGSGRFEVEGNRILTPDGDTFVMRGVVAAYGTFAGGDAQGLGRINERAASKDFDRIADIGANTVKVYVTPASVGDSGARGRLSRLVGAARDEGLVVVLTGFYATAADAMPWVRETARRYADDPYIWLLPMNEPGCTVPDPGSACVDFERWEREHRRYVDAIRQAGMRSPILVNAPGWSWSLARVPEHPLGDEDIVLGAHRYANDERELDDQGLREIAQGWAQLARRRPVVLDEVGNYNGDGFVNSVAWTRDMVDFARNWVKTGEGSGVVAFNWRWSDPNTLTDPANGELTEWGRIFVNRFLEKTNG